TIVGDAAEPLRRQVEHLVFKRVGGEGPAVAEDDRLALAPVLVEDADAVFSDERAHELVSLFASAVRFCLHLTYGRLPAAQPPSRHRLSSGPRTAPSGSSPSRRGNWAKPSCKARRAGRHRDGSRCGAPRK